MSYKLADGKGIMAQIFHPSFNTISRVTIFGALLFALGALWLLVAGQRSDYLTQVEVVRTQPVPFSHQHHVQGLGLDCRYCHWPVETGAFAGIPPTEVCMGCHSQIWSDSPTLEPVRESLRTGRSLRWARVHDLPDYVYFDHSIHVNRGVACVTCHGQVDRMPLTWKVASLQMEWCLECHRDPARFTGPAEAVFKMDYEAPEKVTVRLPAHDFPVAQLDDCSVCHR
jgi:hypothetical protein